MWARPRQLYNFRETLVASEQFEQKMARPTLARIEW